MFEFSLPHLLIVLVIFLFMFGPSRLGDLGSSLGKGIRGFKKAIKEVEEIDVTPSKEPSRIQSPSLEMRSKVAENKESKMAS